MQSLSRHLRLTIAVVVLLLAMKSASLFAAVAGIDSARAGTSHKANGPSETRQVATHQPAVPAPAAPGPTPSAPTPSAAVPGMSRASARSTTEITAAAEPKPSRQQMRCSTRRPVWLTLALTRPKTSNPVKQRRRVRPRTPLRAIARQSRPPRRVLTVNAQPQRAGRPVKRRKRSRPIHPTMLRLRAPLCTGAKSRNASANLRSAKRSRPRRTSALPTGSSSSPRCRPGCRRSRAPCNSVTRQIGPGW